MIVRFLLTLSLAFVCIAGCSNSAEVVKPETMGAKPSGLTKDEKSAGGGTMKKNDGLTGANVMTPVE